MRKSTLKRSKTLHTPGNVMQQKVLSSHPINTFHILRPGHSCREIISEWNISLRTRSFHISCCLKLLRPQESHESEPWVSHHSYTCENSPAPGEEAYLQCGELNCDLKTRLLEMKIIWGRSSEQGRYQLVEGWPSESEQGTLIFGDRISHTQTLRAKGV